MTTSVEFLFDVGSPTAFLAHQRLQQLATRFNMSVELKPILLGGVFKATGNTSPVAIPAKGAYMAGVDLPRFAQRYGVELRFNPFFPINTLMLMRAAIAAREQRCLQAYADAVFTAIWQQEKNMGEPAVVEQVLADAGLDAVALLEGSQDAAVKQTLIDETASAVERGVFGVPTLFIEDEMFFGQDRLDFVEEQLARAA
ncbi:MAG: 2-hydroxychromene-2-carboxylate isomerase [Pseudomonadota bacterium]